MACLPMVFSEVENRLGVAHVVDILCFLFQCANNEKSEAWIFVFLDSDH